MIIEGLSNAVWLVVKISWCYYCYHSVIIRVLFLLYPCILKGEQEFKLINLFEIRRFLEFWAFVQNRALVYMRSEGEYGI